jgi:hypothetical protein
MGTRITDAELAMAYPDPLDGVSATITLQPKPLSAYQIGLLVQLKAGRPSTIIYERRHKTEQKPYYGFSSYNCGGIRRDAIAALRRHGLIERGAAPVDDDPWCKYEGRGHHEVWHWHLTAKGLEAV